MTLGLVLVLCLTLAWSIDDARWVLGRDDLPRLPAARRRRRRPDRVHRREGRLGPLADLPDRVDLRGAHRPALRRRRSRIPRTARSTTCTRRPPTSVIAAYGDIVVRNQASTIQYLHYLLTLGLLVWATSMFASYAVFGHRRPLNAVDRRRRCSWSGTWRITINDQLVYLVLFSLAALFLLIRGHVLDEQSEWLRRRIGDPASIALGLPARRDRVHRGRRRRLAVPDPDRQLEAARRRVGRRQRQPGRPVPGAPAVPAGRRRQPVVRGQLRAERRGAAGLDDGLDRWPSRSSGPRPTRTTTTGARSPTTGSS